MKNIKKALLATSMAGALVVSAGYGTYSWFTSSTQAAGSIQNGTLSVNNGQTITTKLFDGARFAPSQVIWGNMVTLDNTGDLDQTLKLTYNASVDKAPATPYKIMYIAFKSKTMPTQDELLDWRIQWEKGFFNGNFNPNAMAKNGQVSTLPAGVQVVTGEATLDDVQAAAAVRTAVNADGTKKYKIGNDEFFTLKSDEYISIAFDVKMDDNAGNEYQGAKYDGNLQVQAKQTDFGSKYDK
ncbi:hypothetical protein RCG23_13490 [Neobacillus sp. PS3-34]|uniref:hypothetical protein n=1 Tax=Neobacillus sp. PS3-34 TaxID=3070678 RepID=UPI0027E131ED|nr:hypothetical protein [Neobacillus sp. PS3-34]WML46663.1 hypothetical protein RCG23_13490 [Neobacillus sp. PS3-34]